MDHNAKAKMEQSAGNTEKRALLYGNWFFTYNNYTQKDIGSLIVCLEYADCKYVFQEEMGEQGTKHLQGVVKFKARKRLSWVRHLYDTKIHWESCRNFKKAIEYCTKVETRCGDIYSNFIEERKQKEMELRPC